LFHAATPFNDSFTNNITNRQKENGEILFFPLVLGYEFARCAMIVTAIPKTQNISSIE
jgi:hypothetical protein